MTMDKSIKIRHENQELIIAGTSNNKELQSRMNAIQWPQECASCGGPVQKHDSFIETESFGFTNSASVYVNGIPYCGACFAKAKRFRRIDSWRWIVTFLIAAPVVYLLFSGGEGSRYSLWMLCRSSAIFMLISYGLAWLIVTLPARHFMKGNILTPVKGKLFEEVGPDGSKVVSLALSIPNQVFAAKFFDLNNQAHRETPSG